MALAVGCATAAAATAHSRSLITSLIAYRRWPITYRRSFITDCLSSIAYLITDRLSLIDNHR